MSPIDTLLAWLRAPAPTTLAMPAEDYNCFVLDAHFAQAERVLNDWLRAHLGTARFQFQVCREKLLPSPTCPL